MRPPRFSTRLTRLLGIDHPILAGGLGPKVSDARYVASVVNAGGMGFIVGAGYPDPDEFSEQLVQCRELTGGKPFGVNLYISRQSGGVERVRRQVELIAGSSVSCVETAGASPELLMPILREAGLKVIHKVPAVTYAHTAARMGVDAVIVVGNDCGGHPGIYGIGTMVQAVHAAQTLDIPVVVGGGIGHGSQIAAALAMGAEGVIMGTRLLVADDLWIHPSYKAFMVGATGLESTVVKKAIRDNHRVLRNESARAVEALDAAGVTDFEQFRPHVVGSLAQNAYITGDTSRGMLDFGPAAVFADQTESMERIFDRLIDDADIAVRRLQGQVPQPPQPAAI